MTTPKGMRWVDVTYEAERTDEAQMDGVIQGEASMRLLVDESVARWLTEFPPGEYAEYVYYPDIEAILRSREHLCIGKYVEGSAIVRIVDDDEEA